MKKKRLTSLEELLQNIKPSIVVTGEQIERAKNAAENKRKALLTKKNRYDEMLSKVKQERENKRATARQISEQYGVPLELELYEWEWSPKKTFEAYAGTCLLSSLVAQISLLNSQENKIERTRALEQRKVDYLEELAEVKETYFKLVERKFVSQDAITQEIKKYSDKKSEYEAEIKNLQLRKDEINALVMRLQTEVLEQLRKLRENVREQRTILFKGKGQEFSQCLLSIDKAQEVVKNRIDVLETISKTYTESIGVVSKLVNHLNFILGELATSTIWYRPGDAISWTGIKNIPQDIELFFTDLRSYLYQFSFTTFFARLAAPFVQADFLWLLLQSIILLLALVIVRLFVLPVMMTSLLAIAQRHGGLLQWMLFFLVMLASFILRNFLRIFIWLVPFIIIKAYPIPDPYFYILFYLASIPYLLYIARRFIAYFQLFNTQYDYALLSEEFQDRFLSIFSTVIYAVLVLLFFRQAFLRANYQKSELPNIVLAIMLFIIQLALILLPSKEQIVSIIPTQPEAWQWVRFQVNRFYYIMLLFMITIIIMSNTYVGYSNLVLYILSQLFYTLILIRVLFWAHGLIKRWASQIFFSYTPEDIARDRFPHSKTWFGFVIIFSFIVLGFLGAAIGAKIWGGALTFFEVKSWLTEPILGRGTNISISSLDLAQIVAFIVSGFLLAFAFNRFVLQKIFDLMLVDTGLQHAITSITRYIIVAVAILIGLQSVRLGDIVTWAYAALIFGIGYMIKDPAGDLIAYFVILMQRPIKIGDYIWIDDKTMGVVRKITPKSIILRRKNSVTLIVPNRVIISQPVYNWNYTRNFVAFDDIFITIPFRYDPAFAKRLFEEVVDNHAMILKSPKPIIRLDAYGDYGYKFMVRGFVSAAASLQVWQVASDIRIAIVARLKKEGVAIAVPVRVVLKENEFLAQEREEKSSERE